MGHFFFLKLFQREIYSFTLYPFGGILSYKETGNDYPGKDFLISMGGLLANALIAIPLFFLPFKTLRFLNFACLFMNLIPLFPLDGGRILLHLCELFLPYQISKKTIHCFSIFSSLAIFILLLHVNKGAYALFLVVSLLRINISELRELKTKYFQVISERFLHPNDRLPLRKTRLWTMNPIQYLFYNQRLLFDYGSFTVKENIVVKDYFKRYGLFKKENMI